MQNLKAEKDKVIQQWEQNFDYNMFKKKSEFDAKIEELKALQLEDLKKEREKSEDEIKILNKEIRRLQAELTKKTDLILKDYKQKFMEDLYVKQ